MATRESAATRGYDRREMADVGRRLKKQRAEWTGIYDDYLGMLVAMDDWGRPASEVAERAAELADARQAVLDRKFEGVE